MMFSMASMVIAVDEIDDFVVAEEIEEEVAANCIPLLGKHDPVPTGSNYNTGPTGLYCWTTIRDLHCLGCGIPCGTILISNGPTHTYSFGGGWRVCHPCGYRVAN